MSKDKLDKAIMFIPLPNGEALVYELIGTSTAPQPIGSISKKAGTRIPLTITLPVKNWLAKPQRFKVVFEYDKPLDSTISITGLDYIDVPMLLEREYKMNFFTHKDCSISFRVMFHNEESGEYSWYKVQVTASASKAFKTINLESPVRSAVLSLLQVENPLETPVTFAVSCTLNEISYPDSVTVHSTSERGVDITFLPLFQRETTAKLSFTCNQLGSCYYDLTLKGTAPAPEREMIFNTYLGTRQVQVFRFRSFAPMKTEFQCSITDSIDFEVEKSVFSGETGGEVAVDVAYEPTHEGEARATLKVTSAIGGEYLCPLLGTCLPPKPQGPITVKSGTTAMVPIKNVFSKATTFSFYIDNPLFSVKPTESVLQSKKQMMVSVHFKSQNGQQATAKLTVMSPGLAPWIFYIKGIL